MRPSALVLFAAVAVSPPAVADEAPRSWAEFQAANSLTCWAHEEVLPPQEIELGGYRYTFEGTTARVERLTPRAAGAEIKLGVLSGIKELDPKTRRTLDAFVARYRAAGVEALLVGGDNAEDEDNLAAVFEYLGATDLPVYVVIGNWEGRAPFNRALTAANASHPNLINMQLVRRLDGEGYDVISLGGYFDRQFVRNSGGCTYKPEDVAELGRLAKAANDPVILLMHGPPKQKGKEALDYVPDTGNVGDPEVARVIAEAKIPFGIHGHILEAGLRATDASGRPASVNAFHPSLFINPGAANSLPWKLNDGRTDYGSAALLTLRGKQAKVEWLVAPKPEQAMARNRGFTYREQVGGEAKGLTVAAYLAQQYPHSSRAIWEARIDAGEVEVEGRRAAVDRMLVAGDRLDWHRPPWDEPEVPMNFRVVSEDAQLLVVDKPSGLPTAPGGGFLEHTLLTAVQGREPAWSPLHRLGRCTSGLVLFARGAYALSALARDWRRGAVGKHYLAVAGGQVGPDRMVVTQPIGPVPHPTLGTLHAATPLGRRARSEIEVLARRADATLCGVQILTGKPHQIRIHLAYAGHPLYGDPLYGPGGVPAPGTTSLPGDGGYLLHAHRLRVRHPGTGAEVEFVAPPPPAYAAMFPAPALG